MDLDVDACYRAFRTRDARFDGRLYSGCRTTGIFCRPICPVRTPRRENMLFYVSAAAAQAAGFRPCLRCRPEIAPSLAAWRGTSNTVARALSLIESGALDETGVDGLSERLGVGERQLRRLFREHLGASPVARLGELSATYDEARGPGPKVLIRRVWLGDPPREAFDRQQDLYRSYSSAAAQQPWRDHGFLCCDDPADLAGGLTAAMAAAGATCLNLRVHVPGVTPEMAREQITRLGTDVLPRLRSDG